MKQFSILIWFVLIQLNLNAKPFKFEKERMVYYGNFGLQFGSFTFINLSPTVGYKFTDKLALGVGPMVNYMSSSYSKFSNLSYGARLFGRYFILDNAFLVGDYQLVNNYWTSNNERTWLEIPLLGAGYRQSIGANLFLDFSVLWNFNPLSYGFYSNPIVRGGISFR